MPTLVLIVLSATIFVALTQLQWQRPAPLRQSPPPRADEEAELPRAGSGLAGQIAWLGMAAAMVACLGHFAVPAADPFWLALIAAAIASVPIAFGTPMLQRRWRQRHAHADPGSPPEPSALYEQQGKREQDSSG